MFRPLSFALVLGVLALVLARPAQALNVFACEPEWAALAQELGGTDVTVFSATTGHQDPHQIQARPALIARLRAADLVVCTGAELEVGWLPVLLRQSSNPKVQPGQPGFFEAASRVKLLEVPARLDRADGDVHASGNPHIQTDPRNIRLVAAALGPRMGEVDPAHAAAYAQRLKSFDENWGRLIEGWQAAAAPLRGVTVVSYHKGWAYLFAWLGIKEGATIEPKPGVPPGGAYLTQLLDQIPKMDARMVIHAAYEDPKGAAFVSEKAKLPMVTLPFTVGGTEEAKDLTSLFDETVKRLLAGLGGSNGRS